jgi:cytidine deaminase
MPLKNTDAAGKPRKNTDAHGIPKWPDVDRRGAKQRRSERDRRRPAHRPVKEEVVRYNPAERRSVARRSVEDRRDDAAWQPVLLDLPAPEDISGEEALVAAAADARTRARAQFSGFQVGAALETTGGAVITGCNIENATYGLTICAERVALVKALSDGHAVFTRIVVVADTDSPTPPCGSCRQLLWEYCGDIDVILANLDRVVARYRLATLLPLPFDSRLLE